MSPTVPPKILVVDDDRGAVEIVTLLLHKEGYDVLGASNGREALEILAEQTVDIVLLDVMMPEMDGLEVCEVLRQQEHTRNVPVMLLTGKDDLETRVRGMRLGVSEFLTKPINKHALFARIRAQLHQRDLEHEIDQRLSD